jgi:hypothetical protein
MLSLLDLIVNESDKSDFIFSYGYLQKTHTARQIVHYLFHLSCVKISKAMLLIHLENSDYT